MCMVVGMIASDIVSKTSIQLCHPLKAIQYYINIFGITRPRNPFPDLNPHEANALLQCFRRGSSELQTRVLRRENPIQNMLGQGCSLISLKPLLRFASNFVWVFPEWTLTKIVKIWVPPFLTEYLAIVCIFDKFVRSFSIKPLAQNRS